MDAWGAKVATFDRLTDMAPTTQELTLHHLGPKPLIRRVWELPDGGQLSGSIDVVEF